VDEELEAFQAKLDREFRYLNNETALRPDQFVAQGGGDCEDWALMACGLLRYWGWECYIGCYAPPGGQEAHAVWCAPAAAPPGQYVPVDYEVVGGLSEATGRHYRLTRLFEPEELYGLTI